MGDHICRGVDLPRFTVKSGGEVDGNPIEAQTLVVAVADLPEAYPLFSEQLLRDMRRQGVLDAIINAAYVVVETGQHIARRDQPVVSARDFGRAVQQSAQLVVVPYAVALQAESRSVFLNQGGLSALPLQGEGGGGD